MIENAVVASNNGKAIRSYHHSSQRNNYYMKIFINIIIVNGDNTRKDFKLKR